MNYAHLEDPMPTPRTLYRGQFLEFLAAGTWEFVQRPRHAEPVGIVALTADRRLLLISQYRIPVGQICVEIPAGLAGDSGAPESWKAAALRELREETGYTAADMEFLARGPTSAGLTSECMIFARAIGLTQAGPPQPDADEQIQLHEIPLAEVPAFLRDQESQGRLIDPKIYAALYFLAGGEVVK
jgi:ADP-ribose pyrophosphatase